jgi:hypothetical protein
LTKKNVIQNHPPLRRRNHRRPALQLRRHQVPSPSQTSPTRITNQESQIREIPDHQEVYLDTDGYSSIVIEILEYVQKPSDAEALSYHFDDLVDGTGDSTQILGNENVVFKDAELRYVHVTLTCDIPISKIRVIANVV